MASKCDSVIHWYGTNYCCERDDDHDGEKMMHGAVVDDEWTNWTDSYIDYSGGIKIWKVSDK